MVKSERHKTDGVLCRAARGARTTGMHTCGQVRSWVRFAGGGRERCLAPLTPRFVSDVTRVAQHQQQRRRSADPPQQMKPRLMKGDMRRDDNDRPLQGATSASTPIWTPGHLATWTAWPGHRRTPSRNRLDICAPTGWPQPPAMATSRNIPPLFGAPIGRPPTRQASSKVPGNSEVIFYRALVGAAVSWITCPRCLLGMTSSKSLPDPLDWLPLAYAARVLLRKYQILNGICSNIPFLISREGLDPTGVSGTGWGSCRLAWCATTSVLGIPAACCPLLCMLCMLCSLCPVIALETRREMCEIGRHGTHPSELAVRVRLMAQIHCRHSAY